jgi:hypothetical protein
MSSLRSHVLNRENTTVPPLDKAPKKEYYPVSLQQEGVWLQAGIDPGSTIWNTSHSWRYEGRLKIHALTKALEMLNQRHAPLRTNFCLKGERILQFIHDHVPVDNLLNIIDISTTPAEEKESAARDLEIEAAQRPYDLEKNPLARFTLIRLAEQDHLLVMGLHHIITDVTSRQILWKEFITLYNAYSFAKPPELAPSTIHYHDYAEWQQEFLKTPYYEQQKKYWQSRLKGPLPVLNLPADFPRQEQGIGTGKLHRSTVELDPELAEQLRTFSLRSRVPFSAVFLSAFYILLHKYANQNDIVIGSLYKGRNTNKELLENLVGLFANFVALRLHVPQGIIAGSG